MTKKRVQSVALVGCGAVAELSYAKALTRVPNLRAAFACDLDSGAAERVAAMLDAEVVGFAEALERAEVIIIATPPASHFDLASKAIAAGRTVLCEKPFVSSAQEARDLVAQARACGVALYVGHFRRCFPALRGARDLIGSGALGAVREVDVAEGGRFAWASRSRYVETDPHGGVLFDTGSHALDMALFATSLDEAELAVDGVRVRRERPEPAHEVSAEFLVGAEGRTIPMRVRFSRYRVLANRVRIICDGGTVDVSTLPRDRFRVWGPSGSSLMYGSARDPDFQTTFLEQLHRIFGPLDGAQDFAAERFVGLTGILEAIAATAGEAI